MPVQAMAGCFMKDDNHSAANPGLEKLCVNAWVFPQTLLFFQFF
jgi:hypothetical protein